MHKAFSSLVSILFISTGLWLHSLLLKKINSYWRMQAIWTLELGRLTHPRMTITETQGIPRDQVPFPTWPRECRTPLFASLPASNRKSKELSQFYQPDKSPHLPSRGMKEGAQRHQERRAFFYRGANTKMRNMHFSFLLNIILSIHTCSIHLNWFPKL